MLVRLRDADISIPAGRIRQEQALVMADRAAAAKLGTNEQERIGKTDRRKR
jgi:hypothetical protein